MITRTVASKEQRDANSCGRWGRVLRLVLRSDKLVNRYSYGGRRGCQMLRDAGKCCYLLNSAVEHHWMRYHKKNKRFLNKLV